MRAVIKKWRNSIKSGNNAGALFTGFSKAFYCIEHKLSIAKLNAYGCSTNMLKVFYSYLRGKNRRQRNVLQKEGSEFFSYEIELRNRVTQNDVTLRVTNSKIFIEILLSSY